MTNHSSPVTEPALKPCPFCGGSATMEQTGDNRWSVGCDSADEPTCMGYQSFTTFARQREASDAWNRRSAPAQQTPEQTDAEIEAWIRTLDDEKDRNLVRWMERALRAEKELSEINGKLFANAQCAPREALELAYTALVFYASFDNHNVKSDRIDNAADGTPQYKMQASPVQKDDGERARQTLPLLREALALTSTERQTPITKAELAKYLLSMVVADRRDELDVFHSARNFLTRYDVTPKATAVSRPDSGPTENKGE